MLKAIIFDFDGVIADTEQLHLRAFQEVFTAEGVELTAEEYAARYLGRDDRDVFRAVARDRSLALDDLRLESLRQRKAARYEALVGAGHLTIEGVGDKLLEWSERLPLAVASGARRVEVEAVLAADGLLSCFSAIVSAEDVERGKPDPDPYLEALRRIETALGDRLRAEEIDIERALGGRRREERRRLDPSADAQAGTERREVDMPCGGRREADWAEDQVSIAAAHVVAIEDSLSGIASAQAAGMRTVAVTTNYPAPRLRDADLVVGSVADLHLEMLERLVDPYRR